MKIWECKIGEISQEAFDRFPSGPDWPLRSAIEDKYKELTGEECKFCFSGWGGSLSEGERAIVENRKPDLNNIDKLEINLTLPGLSDELEEGEPVFVLRGRDPQTELLIRMWAAISDANYVAATDAFSELMSLARTKYTDNPRDIEKLRSALNKANEVSSWRINANAR